MSKPGHVGRPVKRRDEFFNNEALAPNNSGFKNDQQVADFLATPHETNISDQKLSNKANAADYFHNQILIPERQAAFAQNPLTPFTDEEVKQFAQAMPVGNAPGYLDMSPQMTPMQQRTAIATGALSTNDPRYRDPETLSHYQSQAFNSINTPENITPVEKQFVSQVGGNQPVDETVGAFLSALFHGMRKFMSGVAPDYAPKPMPGSGSSLGGLPNYQQQSGALGDTSAQTGA